MKIEKTLWNSLNHFSILFQQWVLQLSERLSVFIYRLYCMDWYVYQYHNTLYPVEHITGVAEEDNLLASIGEEALDR